MSGQELQQADVSATHVQRVLLKGLKAHTAVRRRTGRVVPPGDGVTVIHGSCGTASFGTRGTEVSIGSVTTCKDFVAKDTSIRKDESRRSEALVEFGEALMS